MADPLHGIITQLEQQKAAIERALAALRNIDDSGETPSALSATVPAKRKGGMVRFTPEGRRRLAEAMKRRWAAKRTAAQAKKRGRKVA